MPSLYTLFKYNNTLALLPNIFCICFRDGIVTTHELFDAIQKLRNAPDEYKTQRLLEVLDDDQDGEISLEELRKVSIICDVP